jgi:hypothetical protein
MTCAAGAGAAARSSSPVAQPHARVGVTLGKHVAALAGAARAAASSVVACGAAQR